MIDQKVCTRRRLKCACKCLMLLVVFAIYVVLLLRESMSALEMQQMQTRLINKHNSYVLAKRLQTIKNTPAIRKKATPIDAKIANQTMQRNLNYHRREKPPPMMPLRTTNEPVIPPTANPIYEYSDEMYAATTNELAQRQNQLWDACTKLDLVGKYPANAWEFFLSPGHNLAWCNVFKAASSTWLYYFNILGGYELAVLQRTKRSPLEMARKQFPRPSLIELEEALTGSISFLFAREPFERLLSAYRDKLEGLHNRFYRALGEQIMKRYRNGAHRRVNKHIVGPTFEEFVRYILENYRRGGRFDEHWTPIHMFCTPCSLNFTIIAKVETFRRDSEYIIRQAGLETLLFNKMPRRRTKTISNVSPTSTKRSIAKYYSQIDINMLDGLLTIYEPDFELFGYNSSKYYNIVQKRQSPSTITTLPSSNT